MNDLFARSDFFAGLRGTSELLPRRGIQRRRGPRGPANRGSFLALPTRGSQGFTLLELIVVVAIVGIVSSLAATDLSGFIGRYRLNSATEELAQVIRDCRMLAISDNRECAVRLVAADPTLEGDWRANIGRYEVVAADGEGWAPTPDGVHDFSGGFGSGYPGVSIEQWTPITGPATAQLPDSIVFSPLGVAANPVSDFPSGGVLRIILRNKRARTLEQRVVRVDRGGNVQIAVP